MIRIRCRFVWSVESEWTPFWRLRLPTRTSECRLQRKPEEVISILTNALRILTRMQVSWTLLLHAPSPSPTLTPSQLLLSSITIARRNNNHNHRCFLFLALPEAFEAETPLWRRRNRRQRSERKRRRDPRRSFLLRLLKTPGDPIPRTFPDRSWGWETTTTSFRPPFLIWLRLPVVCRCPTFLSDRNSVATRKKPPPPPVALMTEQPTISGDFYASADVAKSLSLSVSLSLSWLCDGSCVAWTRTWTCLVCWVTLLDSYTYH